jgi:regulator of PEP synthase PpsR (kinase-PPPase family)
MEMEKEIINRVANSGLITFELEELYQPGERVLIDIKDHLFQGLVLREKDFREFIRSHNWEYYQDKFVAITCTEDVIIPTWAYMLMASALQPFAKRIVFGSLEDLEGAIYNDVLDSVTWENYREAKVVIKGCSKVQVPTSAYLKATAKLRAVAMSIMYGEPCSTVPVYKKPKSVG